MDTVTPPPRSPDGVPWWRRPRRPVDLTDDVGLWFFALFAPAVVLVCGITLLVVDGAPRLAGAALTVVGVCWAGLTGAYLRRPVQRPASRDR